MHTDSTDTYDLVWGLKEFGTQLYAEARKLNYQGTEAITRVADDIFAMADNLHRPIQSGRQAA